MYDDVHTRRERQLLQVAPATLFTRRPVLVSSNFALDISFPVHMMYSKIGCRRTHVLRGQAGRSYLQAAFLSRSYNVRCRM